MRQFLLQQLYPLALRGLPGLGTPEAFAAPLRPGAGTLREQAERLTRRHVALGSAAGFLSGLGGWLTLPVVLPANLAGVALVQLHMAASVAALAGRDPRQPHVREEVIRCLIGDAPAVVPDAGAARTAEEETLDRVGLKLAERGLNLLVTGAVWAGKAAAGSLVKRRLLRGIPLVGGVLGAVSDGYITSAVAEAAIEAFVEAPGDDDGGNEPPHPFAGDGLPESVVDLSVDQ